MRDSFGKISAIKSENIRDSYGKISAIRERKNINLNEDVMVLKSTE